MYYRLKLFFLTPALFIINLLNAQHLIVYESTVNESYLVKYFVNANSNQIVTNYYIEEIAKSIPKMVNYTQYIYSYKQYSRIVKLEPLKYNVNVELNDAKCTGDIFFKGFSMNDVLLPSFISFNLNVYNGNNQLLNSYEFKSVPISFVNSRIADFDFADTTTNNELPNKTYYISVENKLFSYNNQAISYFNQKKKLIEDYYLSDQLMSNCQATLQTIDLQNLEMINLFDIKVDEIEQELSKLYIKEFAEKLKLHIYDPINFLGRIENLSQQVYSIRFSINQILASLDKLYYERGLLMLKSGAVDKAVYNFNKAIEINYFYCPAHYQLALIDFNTGGLDNAATRVKEIIMKMYPDYITQNLVRELALAINEAYLYEGNKLIKSEDYNEALVFLEKGKIFCTSTPGINCEEKLFNSISVAKYGIFTSYMSVADKAVDNNKPELSELYINLAIKYQKENNSDIINTGDIDLVLNKLIIKYIDNGFASNEQKDYKQALEYFFKGQELKNQLLNQTSTPRLNEGIGIAKNGIYQELLGEANKLFLKSDLNNAENITNKAILYQKENSYDIKSALDAELLMTKIKQQQYQSFIIDGKDQLFVNNYENALHFFNTARQLEEKYNIVSANNLDSLIKAAVRPLIFKDIEKADFNIFKGEISEAKTITTSISNMQSLYKLQGDEEINQKLQDLKNKIFTEECKNAQSDYDMHLNAARQLITLKKYLEAAIELETAVNITIDNKVCGISPATAENLKSEILPAVNYQKILIQTEEEFKTNNFGSVIDKYNEAEKFYKQFGIGQFGLQHSSLYDYALQKKSVGFYTYLTDYYTKKEELQLALMLLKVLKSENYPLKNTKLMQESLARMMAAADYNQNPQSNPKLNLTNYVSEDKWFKYYYKAYLKKWKSLK